MRVFQFLINPKLKEGWIADCFSFEPEDPYQKKLGFLFLLCNLKSSHKLGPQFLKELAFFTKENFYKKISLPPKKALKEAISTINEFLKEKIKRGDNFWIGNLDLAILNVKDKNLTFSVLGKMKIQLIRANRIFEIEKREKATKEKNLFFGEVFEGKIFENDILLVENEEVYEKLKDKKIFDLLKTKTPFNENEFKNLILNHKEELRKISGVCFVLDVFPFQGIEKTVFPSPEKKFSLSSVIRELIKKRGNLFSLSSIKEILFTKKWLLFFLLFFLLLLLGLIFG